MTNYVSDLLDKNNIKYRVSGQDFVIHCLSENHDDKNPSLRIDKTTGKFHCFSCGFKGDIFKYFGIITNQVSIRIAKLKEKLNELKMNDLILTFPEGYTPWNKEFRNISSDTLKHFEAFTSYIEELQDRIVFPIRDIKGRIVVFVARHKLSDGNPRYINYPKGVKIPSFPVRIEGFSNIVLVEGIFDMLNLYDKGLKNVVCAFGTNTLQSDTKNKLQIYKTQGIQKVYICFDGDDAGKQAANKLKPIIEQMDLLVEIIQLEDDTDPGELSQEYVTSIKEYIS